MTIICATLIILVSIICYTSYKANCSNKYEELSNRIRYDINEIKNSIQVIELELDSYSETLRKMRKWLDSFEQKEVTKNGN